MKPPPSARLIRGQHSAQGLIGAWTMAENGGNIVSDLSGNANTGTIGGTAPSWTAGKFGSAIYLPGTNESIHFGNPIALGAMTIVWWMKTPYNWAART